MRKKILLILMASLVMGTLAGCDNATLNGNTTVDGNENEDANAGPGDTITLIEEAVKDIEEAEEQEDAAITVSDLDIETLVGSYEDSVSQRATAEVISNGDGSVYISVSWGASAYETYEWYMNARYDAVTNRLVYEDEKEVFCVASEDGDVVDAIKYEAGEGYFELDNGKLKWTGAVDNDCKECIFEKWEEVVDDEEGFMPSSFIEARMGKDVFSSYDEIIDNLIDNEGYAYIELTGYKGKILAITEATYEYFDGNLATTGASLYAEYDGKVVNIGNAYSYGTAYPLRCDGKLIYSAGGHEYNEEFVSKEYGSLMVKTYIHESFDEDGNPSYGGFVRETNSFDSPEADVQIETPEEFYALFESLEDVRVINFIVIGM